ncbi:MAG: hypothetical protein AB7L90_17585 [Hyphomicrobiaceae bacterium]
MNTQANPNLRSSPALAEAEKVTKAAQKPGVMHVTTVSAFCNAPAISTRSRFFAHHAAIPKGYPIKQAMLRLETSAAAPAVFPMAGAR